MRLNLRSSTRAIEWMSSVLARPGTPTMRLLPPTNSVSSTWFDHLVLADDELLQLLDDALAAVLHPLGQRDIVLLHVLFDLRHETLQFVLSRQSQFSVTARYRNYD